MKTNSITPINYSERRARFFDALEKQCESTVAVVPAHAEAIRNHDVRFKFRQDSSFHYLTGFEEPDAIAVLRSVKGKREFTMFVRPKDIAKEIWTGYRCGVEGAVASFGADKAYPTEEFDKRMLELLKDCDRIYYSFFKTMNRDAAELLDQKVLRLLEQHRASLGRTGRGILPFHDLQDVIGEMRIRKTPEEIERLRRASDISARAHFEAMARVKPGIFEYQIEALIEYVFRNEGCERHGYPSIIASGRNATILHYVENNRQMADGDLLLIDAGGEFQYYTSDITRTFPVNGEFTAPQKELYEIVLAVQKECVRMAKPGATLLKIHEFAVSELTDAMIKLGFLKDAKAKAIESLAYKRFYPHGTGHLLGMDVHDIGLYQIDGEPRKLEPGMVFTVEPGFYVLHDDTTVPEKYRGIGIRIEDDVLITDGGHEVLTSGAPKEIAEMTALIGTKRWISLS